MDLSKVVKKISFEENDYINGCLKFDAILKKFQIVAVEHAENAGVGFEDMLKQNLLWVTLRIKYQIIKQPKPKQELILTTNASGKTLLEFDRDFLITCNDEVFIKGTSKWCLIDKDTRKISRMTCLTKFDNLIKPAIFDGKFLKTEMFETENMAPQFEYQVCKQDIDRNGHMNNTIYAKILQNTNSKLEKYNFFQINFVKEALLGQEILVYTKTENKKTTFVGKLKTGEISFCAEVSN